ncbi:MAG: hypothetical protein INR69_22125 [Mucilaginibacter polytrichastri]|nr:hypothetical protein [Mucilaginibacter polytrichastri]
MKKTIYLTLIAACMSVAAMAQTGGGSTKTPYLSIGVEGALPAQANTGLSFGLGGSAKFDFPVAENLYVTASGGFVSFFPKQELKDLGIKNANYVPLKAGAKYFFSPMFYGAAELGAALSVDQGGGTAFAYSPGIGVLLGENIDAGVRYEGWSNNGSFNQVALRLAYRLPL